MADLTLSANSMSFGATCGLPRSAEFCANFAAPLQSQWLGNDQSEPAVQLHFPNGAVLAVGLWHLPMWPSLQKPSASDDPRRKAGLALQHQRHQIALWTIDHLVTNKQKTRGRSYLGIAQNPRPSLA